jgi:hypothetical protein
MAPGTAQPIPMAEVNGKKRSRKWILALSSFFVVTIYGSWGIFVLSDNAQDVALVIAAWLAADTLLLKIYNDANLADNEGGGR